MEGRKRACQIGNQQLGGFAFFEEGRRKDQRCAGIFRNKPKEKHIPFWPGVQKFRNLSQIQCCVFSLT